MNLRKKSVAVTTSIFVIAGTTAALAYWTTTGSGSGTVKNAAANGTLVLHADWAANQLAPGKSLPVTITADNAGQSSLRITSMTATVTTSIAGCLASDFTVGTLPSNVTVAPGTGVAVGSTTLAFADTAADQDACKSADITITLASV